MLRDRYEVGELLTLTVFYSEYLPEPSIHFLLKNLTKRGHVIERWLLQFSEYKRTGQTDKVLV